MNTRALLLLKRAVEHAPEPLGPLLARVPFRLRLGGAYVRASGEVRRVEVMTAEELRRHALSRMREIVAHAGANIPFYREHWASQGFDPATLRTFEDIERIPVVTKDVMKQWSLEARTLALPGNLHLNTGGTSGQPLDFYVDREAFAREWAHMHRIWARVGYEPTRIKLTLRGKNLGSDAARYNAVHNEFILNGYAGMDVVLDAVRAIVRRRPISYLHGYPSSIAEFARCSAERAPDLVEALRRTLNGVLFGSEYPAPIYRDRVEEIFRAPTVSWYGHSEMAILAGETGRYVYAPFQSYGLCEAVPDGEGGHRLVGTSYDNVASPFIRYDTGDSVEAVEEEGGILRAFRIASG